MKNRLSTYAVLFAAALLFAFSAGGCIHVKYPMPNGESVQVTSVLKDVQIGKASYKATPDGGTEFSLEGYDGKARIEVAEKILDALK
jgi:hypothetical protein